MSRNLVFQRRFLQIASRSPPVDNLFAEIDRITGGNIFQNLDWLLNDNENYMTHHIKSLAGTSHPVMNTIRSFIEGKSITFGTMVNLFSEIGNPKKSPDIKSRQLVLAKVTEMLRMASLLHKDVVPIAENKDLYKGNKIALLCGDFLLAKCLNDLAKLRKQFYVEYMSSALRDLTLGRSLGPMDKNNITYPSEPKTTKDVSNLDDFSDEISDYTKSLGHPISEWLLRSCLNGGYLLGKGFSSVLKISDFSEGVRNVGFSFGKYFALILKANEDIHDILTGDNFDLVNLVVYLHMKETPKFYAEILRHRDNLRTVDHKYLARELIGKGSVENALALRNALITSALSCLDVFKESEAKRLMKEFIRNLEC